MMADPMSLSKRFLPRSTRLAASRYVGMLMTSVTQNAAKSPASQWRSDSGVGEKSEQDKGQKVWEISLSKTRGRRCERKV